MMRFKYAYFVAIAGLLGILISFITACSRDRAVEPAVPSIGSEAPDFSITDISGQKVSLKDLRGKSVLINFWATWCYPCREEMDDLQAIYDKYKDKGVVVLGINVREGEGVVKEFAKRFNITYPLLLDEDGKVSDAYNVFGIPSSLFIDKEGVIRDTVMGQMDEEMIAERIDKLISMTHAGVATLLIHPADAHAGSINNFETNKPLRIGLTAVIVQDFLQINEQLLHYIEEKVNIPVELVLKTTYQEMNELLEKGAVDLAFVCSPPYIIGHGKFGLELLVAPQINGKPFYHSYVIVSADSRISKFEDLRSKIYAFSDPLSNSGKLVPTYILARMGETPDTFFKRYIYTYSHYNSIEAVAVGLVDGASVDGYVWELANVIDPRFTSKTKVIEKSFPCPITPFVVRKGIDSKLKDKIASIMLGMHEDKKGREILDRLKIDKFVIVSDDFYNPIREMMGFVEKHE